MPSTTSARADQRRVEPGWAGAPPSAAIVGSSSPWLQTCYRHPNRETGVSCSSCGRPICPDCMTPTPVGMRCPECASQRTKVTRGAVGAGRYDRARDLRPDRAQRRRLPRRDRQRQRRPQRPGGSSIVIDFGLFGPSVAEGEWYRLITGGFLHASLIHIGFNMFAALLPRPHARAGDRHPALRRPLLRLAASPAPSARSCSTPTALTVGASGAVFGIFGADLRHRPRPRRRRARLLRSAFILLINLAFTFGSREHQPRRPPRRARRRRCSARCSSSPASAACSGERHFAVETAGDGGARRRLDRRRDRRRLSAQPPAPRRRWARAPRRSRCCPAGRPGRDGGGGRAARRRRPGAGPGARRSRPRRPRRPARAPSCVDPVPVLERLGARVLDVPAAGHRDRDVGVESRERAPARPRATSGRAGRRRPRRRRSRSSRGPSGRRRRAGRATPARSPAAGSAPATAAAHGGQAALELAAQLVGLRSGSRSPRRGGSRPRASRRACSGPAAGRAGLLGSRAATSSTSS